jgi:hypothetical protein
MASVSVTVSGGSQIVADVGGVTAATVEIASSVSPTPTFSVSSGIGPAAFISGTATAVIGVNPIAAGANITVSTASGTFTVIGRDVPVQSVQGRVGNVVLTLLDLTAAAQSHTHSTTQIVGLTAAASAASPVQSVQGRTGTVTLTLLDLTAAAQSHTHSTTQITGLTAAAAAASPVQSVQGRTGTVTLTLLDLTAAAQSHTHSTTSVDRFTAAAAEASPVQSVAGRTGEIILTYLDVTDITAAANVVSVNGITGTPQIIAGSGVTITTSESSITVAAGSTTGAGGGIPITYLFGG